MGDYDHFPLIETSIRREWFRYPFFFYVRNGDIYRTIYRAEYRKSAPAWPPQLTKSTATGLGRTPQSGVFVII